MLPLLISHRVSRASSRWPIDVQRATTYLTILSVGKSKTEILSVRDDDLAQVQLSLTIHHTTRNPITPFKRGATLTGTLDEMDEDQRKRTRQSVKDQMMGEQGRSTGLPHDVHDADGTIVTPWRCGCALGCVLLCSRGGLWCLACLVTLSKALGCVPSWFFQYGRYLPCYLTVRGSRELYNEC